ncbi:MAG: ABC transporter ATP-binding protein [Clostridiales bacterium]|jgi:branched-chain amino acid transport system ATP-binding protein|nr:ABC transporter ATP-binding protein [Clostridiales bacterium]
MPFLSVKNLGVSFGGLKAVDGFSLEMGKDELLGLIGPNGAGKTTVFNLLTGVYAPSQGSVSFNGKIISKLRTSAINDAGIARTFQNIRLFKNLSVMDNVRIALHGSMRYSPLTGILRLREYWEQEEETDRRAVEILEVFGLSDAKDEKASSLPYGRQRKLEIARALGSSPKLLLLDEPAAGMNHSETSELMDTISFVRKKFSVAILLIEHDMQLVMGICERIVVMDYGTVIASGSPEEIKSSKVVIAAYLGE